MGGAIEKSSNFFSKILLFAPVFSVLMIGACRIMGCLLSIRYSSKISVVLEKSILNLIQKKSLNFFNQRSLVEIKNYVLDADIIANLLANTLPLLQGSVVSLLLSFVFLYYVYPIKIFAVVAIFVTLTIFLSLASFSYLENLREKTRVIRSRYEMMYETFLINPIGGFYFINKKSLFNYISDKAKRAIALKARLECYTSILQSLRLILISGISFGLAHFVGGAWLCDVTQTALLYPLTISLGYISITITDSIYLYKKEILAVIRCNRLYFSKSRTKYMLPLEKQGVDPSFNTNIRRAEEKEKRIIIAGGNGIGKTTLLLYVSGLIEKENRYVKKNAKILSFIQDCIASVNCKNNYENGIMYLNSSFTPFGITVKEALSAIDEQFIHSNEYKNHLIKLGLHKVTNFLNRQIYGEFSILSEGERQRLALLFALKIQPKVLILDLRAHRCDFIRFRKAS